uniref:Venom s1 protease 14 n=1 Tax=Pristhesancus plagipennis TaxID=1955184 RepID=A0A1Q1NPE9_PRIPG|nr:venom s1 protease 14 [Pristhesancus plagipennis]
MNILPFSIFLLLIGWRQVVADDVDSSEYGKGGGTKKTDCKCGWTNNPVRRIVGGEEAGINEFPWVVGIKASDDGGPGCGGVILSKRIVLTASHCTEALEKAKIQVIVGEHDVLDDKETPVTQVINVKKYVQHPSYDLNGYLENDIALLLLEKDIEMSDRVGPICLPTAKNNYVRQTVKVMGWGKLGTNKGSSRVLRKVELDVIPLPICAKAYQGISQKRGQVSQFCTFTLSKDSCQGDSGGPVVWRDPELNLYTSIGIISFGGDECGMAPGVNTDVFFFKDWIVNAAKELDSSQSFCQKVEK